MTARSAFESLAKEALQRQDCWLAESLLKEYLAAGPRCVAFIEMLAHVYEEKGDPLAAVAEYAKAIEILIEDGDPDNLNRPAELYAKIRELAPASPDAFRLAAQFDAATGKILRPSPVDVPAESTFPPASQSVEGDGTPGEPSEQSMLREKVEDSTTQSAPVASQEETEQAAEVPASEVWNPLSGDDPVVAEAESRQQVVTGESESSQNAGPQATEVPPVFVQQAIQPAGSADEVTSSPVLALQIQPAPAVVDEPGDEETFKLVKIGEDADDFVESIAAEAGVEERLSEAGGGRVSEAEEPATVLQSPSGCRLESDAHVDRVPLSAPMPWEQLEEATVQIMPPELQPTSTLAVEPEALPLAEGSFTEAETASVKEPSATFSAANDQAIEQQVGSIPEIVNIVTTPPKAEEPQPSLPAASGLAALSWEEILGNLGLDSWTSALPVTPQAESAQSLDLPPPSPAPLLDETIASPMCEAPVVGDVTARTIDGPSTPLPVTSAPNCEVASGEAGASPVLSVPMPWEQVEEVSVPILQQPEAEPEPAPTLAVESETPPLPEGLPTEVASVPVTQPTATSAAAGDQSIEQQGRSIPETAEIAVAPPAPAASGLAALSWEEMLRCLGLSLRTPPLPAAPQAEPAYSYEASPSPAPVLDEAIASPPCDATAPVADELPPPPAIPPLDAEVSHGDAVASSALPTPMPWEQVEETSVPIPLSESEPIEVQPAQPEEAVASSPESLETPLPVENTSLHATATEAPAPEIQTSPVEPVQAELVIESNPIQLEPEFRLAIAAEQSSEPLPSHEASPTGSELAASTGSNGVQQPVVGRQDTVASLAPESPSFSILLEPTVEELKLAPPPAHVVFQEIAPPPPLPLPQVHEEVVQETKKTVPAETEIALAPPVVEPSAPAPPAMTEQVESPIVSSSAPPHPGSQEEHISQASEEPITLKLHLPHAVPIREEVLVEDPPWSRIPEPESEPVAVAPESAPIPAGVPTPQPLEAADAPIATTMASAVDVLFERTGTQTSVSTHDKPATVKLKTRRTLPFARARMGLVLFVRNSVSTTRSIIVSLLGLIGLAVAMAIVCIGATGLLWVAMEERPNNAFHNLTTTPQRNISDPKKNGYLLLLGIDATPARDPLQVGYERKFEETDRDMLRMCLTGNDGSTTTGSASSQVLSGWLRAADPAAQFKTQASGVKTWLVQSDVMLGRYRQWLKMSFEDWGYGQSIVPNCRQILAVHRLFLAEGFAQDLDSGMERLEADMTAWRMALAQARTLAVKMMAVAAVTDDMAIASGLLTRPDLDPKYVPRLLKQMRPLDQVEQSVRWPMQSQFVLATKTLDNDLRRDKVDERPWYVSVAAAMPLPKQRRFNAYADYYEAANKTSAEVRPTSMPNRSKYIKTTVTSWLDYLLNPIEHVVGVEPLPRWEDYSGRILETDARLRLVSLQAWVRKGPSEGELATRIAKAGQHFYDPFTGLPMLINSKKGLIYSAGRDGKDQEGDPKFDVAVSVPPFSADASTDTKRTVSATVK